MHQDIERILLSEAQIVRELDRLAVDIHRDFGGSEFTVVGVLKGAAVFVSDLIRRLPDPIELSFVAARSYGDGTVSGKLAVDFLPLDAEISGRRILLVDDILDTGRTLAALKQALLQRGAALVATCVFLDKPARRAVPIAADFRCFEVEDTFVVGYGLDYAGRYRNLPFVGALKPSVFAAPASAPNRSG